MNENAELELVRSARTQTTQLPVNANVQRVRNLANPPLARQLHYEVIPQNLFGFTLDPQTRTVLIPVV